MKQEIVMHHMFLSKFGEWVNGPQRTPVPDNTRWTIDVASIQHGWQCWTPTPEQKFELFAEVWAPIHTPLPEQPLTVKDEPFRRALSLEMVDANEARVRYVTSTVGGMRAIDDLMVMVNHRQETNRSGDPVVELRTECYTHHKFGNLFIPLFAIVGWA